MDTTDAMTNHRQYYAIATKLGLDTDTRAAIIAQYTNGKTTSLKVMAADHRPAYCEMLAGMQAMLSETKPAKTTDSDELDRWRKRCIAAISAWLDSTGCKPINRMAYIRETACRSAGKDGANFNTLTASQLRNVYNAFCRQNEAMERARQLKQVINPSKN